MLSDIEIKAEVFRIIRNYSDQPKYKIIAALKKHLPDVSMDKIKQAIRELGEK